MHRFLIFCFFLSLTTISWADINCVGNTSCGMIDNISKKVGLSLPIILDELNNNIVIPIESNEERSVADDLSHIITTPTTLLPGQLKLSIAGNLVLGSVPIKSRILGYPFVYNQMPGSVTPNFVIEIGGKQSDIIINIGGKFGPADLGLGITTYTTSTASFKSAFAKRIHILKNETFSLVFLFGMSYGYSEMNVSTNPGATISIYTNYGKVGWQGNENYTHFLHVIGSTYTIIGTVKHGETTFGLDLGITQANILGKNTFAKYGVVGPFLGTTGFFNVGVESSSYLSDAIIIPRINLSGEWEYTPDWYIGCSYGTQFIDNYHRGSLTLSTKL